MSTATSAGLYLYAIADDTGAIDLPAGIDEQPVAGVRHGGIVALVGELRPTATRLRAERRNVMAHHRVLAAINRAPDRGVLPMQFGVVVPDEAEVARMLSVHEANLAEQLTRVRGRVEMGIKVGWPADKVFELLLALYPALRAARDSAPRTREGAISMGKQVALAMETHRTALDDRIREHLGDVVSEFAFNPPKSDAQLANAAALVPRANAADFDAAVGRLAGTLDDNYGIDISGPWAPHNFIRLNLVF